MIEVKVINRIGERLEEYIERTGASKTWIAKQMGYRSRQSIDGAILSTNPTAETLAKLSVLLNCSISDLIEIEVISK